jgi:hypothetical protein
MALALIGAGCAPFISSGPVGPVRRESATQLSLAWGYAYGPTTATVGGMVFKGNGQEQAAGGGGLQIPTIVPVTVGVEHAMGDGLELSADIGAVDSGVRLRLGLPGGPSAPAAIAFEGRTGQISAFPTDSYQASMAFEIYPDITPAHASVARRLILAVGIAGGVFQHQLTLPYAFNQDYDLPFGGPSMTVLRSELRLETAVGIYLGSAKSLGLSVVVAPWILLGSPGSLSATCNTCSDSPSGAKFSVTDFSEGWGLSLIVTPSFAWFHGGSSS